MPAFSTRASRGPSASSTASTSAGRPAPRRPRRAAWATRAPARGLDGRGRRRGARRRRRRSPRPRRSRRRASARAQAAPIPRLAPVTSATGIRRPPAPRGRPARPPAPRQRRAGRAAPGRTAPAGARPPRTARRPCRSRPRRASPKRTGAVTLVEQDVPQALGRLDGAPVVVERKGGSAGAGLPRVERRAQPLGRRGRRAASGTRRPPRAARSRAAALGGERDEPVDRRRGARHHDLAGAVEVRGPRLAGLLGQRAGPRRRRGRARAAIAPARPRPPRASPRRAPRRSAAPRRSPSRPRRPAPSTRPASGPSTRPGRSAASSYATRNAGDRGRDERRLADVGLGEALGRALEADLPTARSRGRRPPPRRCGGRSAKRSARALPMPTAWAPWPGNIATITPDQRLVAADGGRPCQPAAEATSSSIAPGEAGPRRGPRPAPAGSMPPTCCRSARGC